MWMALSDKKGSRAFRTCMCVLSQNLEFGAPYDSELDLLPRLNATSLLNPDIKHNITSLSEAQSRRQWMRT
jgi:hypothetical protein